MTNVFISATKPINDFGIGNHQVFYTWVAGILKISPRPGLYYINP